MILHQAHTPNPSPQTRNRRILPRTTTPTQQFPLRLRRPIRCPTKCGTNANIPTAARTHSTDLTRCAPRAVGAGGEASTGRAAVDAEAGSFGGAGADAGAAGPAGAKGRAGLARTGVAGAGAVGADAG